ncbi:MAG: hypothetical protein A2Y59_03300 [Chloroflexi bacterium RBG_13_52_14]|nr:MAG: hypothetical protein A2Y59_03300 [Chloroflexi bacterium RBG_13_52_14]
MAKIGQRDKTGTGDRGYHIWIAVAHCPATIITSASYMVHERQRAVSSDACHTPAAEEACWHTEKGRRNVLRQDLWALYAEREMGKVASKEKLLEEGGLYRVPPRKNLRFVN